VLVFREAPALKGAVCPHAPIPSGPHQPHAIYTRTQFLRGINTRIQSNRAMLSETQGRVYAWHHVLHSSTPAKYFEIGLGGVLRSTHPVGREPEQPNDMPVGMMWHLASQSSTLANLVFSSAFSDLGTQPKCVPWHSYEMVVLPGAKHLPPGARAHSWCEGRSRRMGWAAGPRPSSCLSPYTPRTGPFQSWGTCPRTP